MSTRRDAREYVMQALYAYEVAGGRPDHFVYTVLRKRLKDDDKTLAFAEELFQKTLDYANAANDLISKHAKNWDLDRIAPIDRALLRMATAELLAFEEIPPKVSIDEAIEIAKKYSTPRSGTFINGILDSILMDLQEQGRLEKTGRGLVGMDSIRDRQDS